MSDNDRSTFGAGMRVEETLVVVDIPCTVRSDLSEDIAKTVVVIEAVKAKLDQQTKVLYGELKIKAHHWRWERVLFQRGDGNISYSGVKFFIYARGF